MFPSFIPASFRPLRKDERGFTLVFFAVALPVMLGVAGLVIDLGRLYAFDSQLARAADTAALSAANQLDRTDSAIERARAAADALAQDSSSADEKADRLTLRFSRTLSELRASSTFTLADVEASQAVFVEVTAFRGSLTASFLQFVGARPVQVQRGATAMSQYYACDVTPLLLCQRDPQQFFATASKGRQYLLRHRGDQTDGALVMVDAPGDPDGKQTPARLASNRPAFCYAAHITIRPGITPPEFDDAINIRFDRYVNARGPIAPELAAFPPAPNVIKGQRYNSCSSPPNAADFNPPYHLPRDSAFRAVNAATPYDLGRGDWKTTLAYGGSGSSVRTALDEYIFWHHSNKNAIFRGRLQTSPTRYDIYLRELGLTEATEARPISTFAGSLANTLPSGGPRTGPYRTFTELAAPRCYRGSIPANEARRRIIYATVADCANFDKSASADQLSQAVAKFFLTEPARGGAIFAEFQNVLVPANDDGKLRHVVQLVSTD